MKTSWWPSFIASLCVVFTTTTTTSAAPSNSESSTAAALADGRLATGLDSNGMPIYPASTQLTAYTPPKFLGDGSADQSLCSNNKDKDSFVAGTDSNGVIQVRSSHPRLFATGNDWDCLAKRTAGDPYLRAWHDTIMKNATEWLAMPPQPYVIDGIVTDWKGGLGDSGILDPARIVGLRIKHWGYAYRVTNDRKWAERAWLELLTASGNNPAIYWGPAGDNWNTIHFLDTAELSLAFSYGYDWFYDAWNTTQRTLIREAIVNLALLPGLAAYQGDSSAADFMWWTGTIGNWNCVPAAGLAAGALAIYEDDTTGTAKKILPLIIDNVQGHCLNISIDGTTPETPDYWYFHTTGAATLSSALLSATGDVHGTMGYKTGTAANLWELVADFHVYVKGMTRLFQYGDHGPNKYVATSNSLMFWGKYNRQPRHVLYQRDQADAAEPLAMFWYDTAAAGAWWNGLPLDHHFPEDSDSWASMRSSWTDNTGVYVAMKAAQSTNHATHQDLDQGDFVLDAMGERWAGELGSGNYISDGYFSSELQDSQRWTYYRKRTEGQNTINIVGQNQNVGVIPVVNYASTNEAQGASTSLAIDSSSAVYFWSDNTACYNETSVAKRGIRLLNKRRQVLLQDELDVHAPAQWRMHTNATVSIENGGTTATLKLGGKALLATLRSASGSAKFGTAQPVRLASDPPLNQSFFLDGFGNEVQKDVDQPNVGVTVLTINVPAGKETLYVSFEPQWDGKNTKSMKPATVPLEKWGLSSHLQ